MENIYQAALWEKVLTSLYDRFFYILYGRGDDFMEEAWDNLVILDACRFDDFRRENFLEGELESRISPATDSPGFIEKTFNGRELHDTVYVTANPHVYRVEDGVFHAIIDEPLKEFDPELGTVPPEKVTEAALEANDEFPDKRLIIHYMQPHDPPIGDKAGEIRESIELGGWRPDQEEDREKRLMNALARGDIEPETAREAYRENLRIVLGEVETLLEKIDGRTVVTADHGEMFGEYYPLLGSLYEHWKKPRTVELCKVPWFKAGGKMRTTTAEKPVRGATVDEEDIKQQMKKLGYG
ncbi:MAG: hypothetical protein ABEI58_03025 [Candidatus Nanohaloarchaea archaeon]